jgi:hypothetical protein
MLDEDFFPFILHFVSQDASPLCTNVIPNYKLSATFKNYIFVAIAFAYFSFQHANNAYEVILYTTAQLHVCLKKLILWRDSNPGLLVL